MPSAAPKKKAFDRGGPVWPPRSNAADDPFREGSGGALTPKPKMAGSRGQRPPAKIRGEILFFEKKKIRRKKRNSGKNNLYSLSLVFFYSS